MGMFDTVNFYCPVCGAIINIQSKAADCMLKEYDRADVPIRIAADILGEEVTCSDCKTKLEVYSPIGKYVQMYLNILSIGNSNE